MRPVASLLLTAGLLAAGLSQPPGGGGGPDPGAAADRVLTQFDADKDGKITATERTDDRLKALLDRADADKDGTVTRAELVSLFTKEAQAGGGKGGPGGPGGKGPKGGGPGMGGPGGMGGPPAPGQVLPPFLQDELKLTADQKKRLADLQKMVDEKLAGILTAEQKRQFEAMKTRGPGGFGPKGGRPGGPPGGGPGSPPPGGPGGPPPGE